MDTVDVIIVGAGTAGLGALREVRKSTQSFLIVNDGPWGTMCARVGCMPSKALIEAAGEFHRRLVFAELGLSGGDGLRVEAADELQVMVGELLRREDDFLQIGREPLALRRRLQREEPILQPLRGELGFVDQHVDVRRRLGGTAELAVRIPWNEPIMVKRLLDKETAFDSADAADALAIAICHIHTAQTLLLQGARR